MFRFFRETILISVILSLAKFSFGQADTTNWKALLQYSNFAEINSIKKIDKNILTKFPSWKKMSKPKGRFNSTDVGGGRRRRLYFIAKVDNHWIISYEHGGRGYHTHCFFITTADKNNISIQHSYLKCETLNYVKAFANTEKNFFDRWSNTEY